MPSDFLSDILLKDESTIFHVFIYASPELNYFLNHPIANSLHYSWFMQTKFYSSTTEQFLWVFWNWLVVNAEFLYNRRLILNRGRELQKNLEA